MFGHSETSPPPSLSPFLLFSFSFSFSFPASVHRSVLIFSTALDNNLCPIVFFQLAINCQMAIELIGSAPLRFLAKCHCQFAFFPIVSFHFFNFISFLPLSPSLILPLHFTQYDPISTFAVVIDCCKL